MVMSRAGSALDGRRLGYSAAATPTSMAVIYAHELRNAAFSFARRSNAHMAARLTATANGITYISGYSLKLCIVRGRTAVVTGTPNAVSTISNGTNRRASLRDFSFTVPSVLSAT